MSKYYSVVTDGVEELFPNKGEARNRLRELQAMGKRPHWYQCDGPMRDRKEWKAAE